MTSEGLLSVEPFNVEITEDLLGDYEAAALRLRTPDGITLEVVPVARLIIGGTGRIDIQGGAGREVLIRTGRDGHEFVHVRSRQPLVLMPIDETLFSVLILRMVQ